MPSLADIPRDLRNRNKADAFTKWLTDLPLDFPTARTLAHIWQRAAKHPLGITNWQTIEDTFKAK